MNAHESADDPRKHYTAKAYRGARSFTIHIPVRWTRPPHVDRPQLESASLRTFVDGELRTIVIYPIYPAIRLSYTPDEAIFQCTEYR